MWELIQVFVTERDGSLRLEKEGKKEC